MNRPKITKQTLKELRGDLWTKQSQKQVNNNENDDALSPAVTQTDEMDVNLTQEEENELNM